jgi:hypothetical protein
VGGQERDRRDRRDAASESKGEKGKDDQLAHWTGPIQTTGPATAAIGPDKPDPGRNIRAMALRRCDPRHIPV